MKKAQRQWIERGFIDWMTSENSGFSKEDWSDNWVLESAIFKVLGGLKVLLDVDSEFWMETVAWSESRVEGPIAETIEKTIKEYNEDRRFEVLHRGLWFEDAEIGIKKKEKLKAIEASIEAWWFKKIQNIEGHLSWRMDQKLVSLIGWVSEFKMNEGKNEFEGDDEEFLSNNRSIKSRDRKIEKELRVLQHSWLKQCLKLKMKTEASPQEGSNKDDFEQEYQEAVQRLNERGEIWEVEGSDWDEEKMKMIFKKSRSEWFNYVIDQGMLWGVVLKDLKDLGETFKTLKLNIGNLEGIINGAYLIKNGFYAHGYEAFKKEKRFYDANMENEIWKEMVKVGNLNLMDLCWEDGVKKAKKWIDLEKRKKTPDGLTQEPFLPVQWLRWTEFLLERIEHKKSQEMEGWIKEKLSTIKNHSNHWQIKDTIEIEEKSLNKSVVTRVTQELNWRGLLWKREEVKAMWNDLLNLGIKKEAGQSWAEALIKNNHYERMLELCEWGGAKMTPQEWKMRWISIPYAKSDIEWINNKTTRKAIKEWWKKNVDTQWNDWHNHYGMILNENRESDVYDEELSWVEARVNKPWIYWTWRSGLPDRVERQTEWNWKDEERQEEMGRSAWIAIGIEGHCWTSPLSQEERQKWGDALRRGVWVEFKERYQDWTSWLIKKNDGIDAQVLQDWEAEKNQVLKNFTTGGLLNSRINLVIIEKSLDQTIEKVKKEQKRRREMLEEKKGLNWNEDEPSWWEEFRKEAIKEVLKNVNLKYEREEKFTIEELNRWKEWAIMGLEGGWISKSNLRGWKSKETPIHQEMKRGLNEIAEHYTLMESLKKSKINNNHNKIEPMKRSPRL